MKYLGENIDGKASHHTLPQNVLLNLSQTRSFEKLNSIVSPKEDWKKFVIFSTDKDKLAKLDLANILGISGVTELDEHLIDYKYCDKEEANEKIQFSTKQYALDRVDILEKPLWQLVCNKVATKGV